MHHVVEREHSILQYVTLALDVYQVCRCVGRFVKNGSCSSPSLSLEGFNGQYWWNILLSPQMLLNGVVDDSFAPMHLAFNTVQLL